MPPKASRLTVEASELSVSPDGQYLLYSQYDQSSAEIVLVENFK